ncbi:MAG: hypothetical protein AAFV53_39985 [Myxococcota bacterium]
MFTGAFALLLSVMLILQDEESYQDRSSPDDATHQPISAESLDLLRAEISQLRREQNTLTDDIDDLYAQADKAADDGDEETQETSAEAAVPELSAEELEALTSNQVKLLDEHVIGETPDRTWKEQAEAAIDQMIREQSFEAGSVVETECARSICRLEFAFDDERALDSGSGDALKITPWPGESFYIIEGGDTPRVVLYLAREGHSLPRVMM